MSEEEVRSLCRRCDHYKTNQFDTWMTDSIYNPKIVTNKFRHFIDRNEPKAFVYFITDGNYIKIGKAQDPLKRLAGIQTGNPNKCDILYLVPCKAASMATQIESYLHKTYEKYRLCGEWFNIKNQLEHEKWLKMFPASEYIGEAVQ